MKNRELSTELARRLDLYKKKISTYCMKLKRASNYTNIQLPESFEFDSPTEGHVGLKNIVSRAQSALLQIKETIQLERSQNLTRGFIHNQEIDQLLRAMDEESMGFANAILAFFGHQTLDTKENESTYLTRARLTNMIADPQTQLKTLEAHYRSACSYANQHRGTFDRVADFFHDIAEGLADLIQWVKREPAYSERSLHHSTGGLIDRFFNAEKHRLTDEMKQSKIHGLARLSH